MQNHIILPCSEKLIAEHALSSTNYKMAQKNGRGAADYLGLQFQTDPRKITIKKKNEKG
jgi:hypothetical protein